MAEIPKLETNFNSKEYSHRRKQVRISSGKPRKKSGVSLFSLLCVIVAGCTLLLATSFSGSEVFINVIADAREVLQSEYPLDEALGKLTFVSNETAEVFGINKDSYALPLAQSVVFSSLENGGVVLKGEAGSDVLSCFEGRVSKVDDDYVVITAGDLDAKYSKIQVLVEKDQPVKRKDVIGTTQDGLVELMIYENEIAVDACKFLGIKGN